MYVGLADDPEARAWIDVALAAAGGDPQLDADDRLVEELRRAAGRGPVPARLRGGEGEGLRRTVSAGEQCHGGEERR